MTTTTQQPVMTLEETKDRLNLLLIAEEHSSNGTIVLDEQDIRGICSSLHHLKAGKRECRCDTFKHACEFWRHEPTGEMKLLYGNPPVHFCPWCGGTVSPQPSQQEGQ